MNFIYSRFSEISSLVASVGIAVLLAQPALAINPLNVKPILRSVSNPQEITGGLDDNINYSFGYAFDVNQDGWRANALGFGFQNNWLGGSSSSSYQVSLWSVLYEDPEPDSDPTVNLLASSVFDPSQSSLSANLFDSAIGGTSSANQGLYYWLEIPSRNLPKSSDNPDFYYLIGVSGRFAGTGAILPRAFGALDFTPAVSSYIFEGFNDSNTAFYPAPIFAFSDSSYKGQGFWNANVSLDVPGPLPVLGVGAAFGWSRRLKRKLSKRNQAE